jgi:hypothetical protein
MPIIKLVHHMVSTDAAVTKNEKATVACAFFEAGELVYDDGTSI